MPASPLAGHGHREHRLALHLPSPGAFLRHSLPGLLEGVIGPFVLFYLVLVAVGFRAALLAGLAWYYAALVRRLLGHQRPSGVLILGTAMLTVRTVVSFVTGSAFLYFAQPTAGNCLMGLLFLVSALLRRPLAERLAKDFCPFEPHVLARPHMRRFFIQISLLWAFVLLTNAGFVTWLLLTSSLKAFVVERTAVSWALSTVAIALSVGWFIRSMRRSNVTVHWGSGNLAQPTAPEPG